jgi:two-component system sensor histidine kinase TctE
MLQTVDSSADWAQILREVALDLSPLIAAKDLDFEIGTVSSPIRTHPWMLRELFRNLLHNAISYTPAGGILKVQLSCDSTHAYLLIRDSGPGISAELQTRLFQTFSAGQTQSGSGLGLAICHEIVRALGGEISLTNRVSNDQIAGLDSRVRLPSASGTMES